MNDVPSRVPVWSFAWFARRRLSVLVSKLWG